MCRLFGLHTGRQPVAATFWLLDAPDSLAAQSHGNPDGAGIGIFCPPAPPVVDKQPLAAWDDPEFTRAARTLRANTFLAHVRYASTGALSAVNTHPFLQDGRLFAHNGVVEGLPEMEARLRELGAADLLLGDTDSERLFALITAETRQHGGDVQQGLTAAVTWIAEQIPLYSVNLILATATDLFALRYPATNELYVLERKPGGHTGQDHLHAHSSRIHAHSPELADKSSVLFASERMDEDPNWRLMEPGELIHVGPDLSLSSSHPFPATPSHQLTLDDLNPTASQSQASAAS
jgi:predicted glutamine amidotransferase